MVAVTPMRKKTSERNFNLLTFHSEVTCKPAGRLEEANPCIPAKPAVHLCVIVEAEGMVAGRGDDIFVSFMGHILVGIIHIKRWPRKQRNIFCRLPLDIEPEFIEDIGMVPVSQV